MPKKFNPNQYQFSNGVLWRIDDYIGSQPVLNRASSKERALYRAWMEGPKNAKSVTVSRSSKVLKVQPRFNKYFNANTLTGPNGRVVQWAKPLTLKAGENPVYGWERAKFSSNGSTRLDSFSRKWGANVGKTSRSGAGYNGATVLIGTKEWIRQIQISLHQLAVNAEYFRIAVGHRALKVFQESFKYQRFYASSSPKWKPLAPWTIEKRSRRKDRAPGMQILKEYGDLMRSIKIDETASPIMTRIYTDIVHGGAHHKKHSICYAGYHNDPRPGDTYGRGFGSRPPKPYVQRQFMGFSDKIDDFAYSIMKRYLFDSVFLMRKL